MSSLINFALSSLPRRLVGKFVRARQPFLLTAALGHDVPDLRLIPASAGGFAP